MKSRKITEITLIIMLAKNLINESEKEETKNWAYQCGYLQECIESIYKILEIDINKIKKVLTNE